MEDWLTALKANPPVLLPLATFFLGIFVTVLGFLASRWTMSKKERKDVEQQLYENGKELMLAQLERYQEFVAVFQSYIKKDGSPTFDDFAKIATVGEKYFYQQKITSNAILFGKVDAQTRDNTLVPRIVECVQKNLPNYYRTLQSIARNLGFEYAGELKRENYESLYVVAEKYGKPIATGAASSAASASA